MIVREMKKHSQKVNALAFLTNITLFLPAIRGDIPKEYMVYYVGAMVFFNIAKFAFTAYKQDDLG